MLDFDTRIIKPNETITLEKKRLLLSYPKNKINSVFMPVNDRGRYNVEYECPICGTIFFAESTRGKIFKERMCGVCEAIEKEERKDKERTDRENMKNRHINATNKFIDTFLSPDNSWKEDVSNNTIWNELTDYFVYRDVVRDFVNKMPYQEFLQTPYWKGVAKLVRARAKYKCELCGKGGLLNVHHKTYENHGDEIHHLKDLICLCEDCHQKFHDKLAE